MYTLLIDLYYTHWSILIDLYHYNWSFLINLYYYNWSLLINLYHYNRSILFNIDILTIDTPEAALVSFEESIQELIRIIGEWRLIDHQLMNVDEACHKVGLDLNSVAFVEQGNSN